MPRPQPRPPPPDRDERHVDPGELGHPVEEIGVACVVGALRPLDHEADRLHLRAEGQTAAVVLRRRGPNPQRPDLEILAYTDLGQRREALATKQPRRPAWDDDRQVAPEPLEGWEVEMVEMKVRDEHGIETAQRVVIHANGATQMRHDRPQHGIGEEADSVEVDEHGAVPHVDEAECHRAIVLTGICDTPQPMAADSAPAAPERGPAGKTRRVLARALVVVGILLAVVSALANFVRYEALDSDQFRATSRLLVSNEEIQTQVAAVLVDALYENVDVAAELEDELPENLQPLAGPIAGISRELADRAAKELLERPAVQSTWVELTGFAHERLINVLEGDTRVISTAEGDVTLDLQPLVVNLADRFSFVGDAATRLPEGAGRITILESDDLETAQNVTQALKFVAQWIWVLALAAWATAIWLVRGRRRVEVRAIAIGLIVTGFLVIAVRALAGDYVVDTLVESESVKPAVAEAWDIITRLLAGSGWSLVIVGVVALAGVWLAGPGSRATGARRALAPSLRRPEVAFGTTAVLYLLLLLWQPTPQFGRWLWVVVFAVLAGIGVEVLRRQAVRDFPDAVAVEGFGDVWDSAGDWLRGRRGKDAAPVTASAGELERLAALHAGGALSDEEFAAAKAALLAPPDRR